MSFAHFEVWRSIMKSAALMGISMVLGSFLTGCAMKSSGHQSGGLDRVHFDYDQSAIASSAQETLDKNSETAKAKHPQKKIIIEGHCDERGTNEYNIALGERRARAVRDYMVSRGVPRKNLEVKSVGEENPIDKRQTEEAYHQNRRADFVVISMERN